MTFRANHYILLKNVMCSKEKIYAFIVVVCVPLIFAGDAAFSNLKEKILEWKYFSGSFEVIGENNEKTGKGNFFFNHSKFKLEAETGKVSEIFLCDGAHIIHYVKGDSFATRTNWAYPGWVFPDSFLSYAERVLDITCEKSQKGYKLTLSSRPTEPAIFLKNLSIYFNRAGLPEELKIEGSESGIKRVRFNKVSTGKFEDSVFTFSAPVRIEEGER